MVSFNLSWLYTYMILPPFQLWLHLSSMLIHVYWLSFSIQCLFPLYVDSYMYWFIISVLLYIFWYVLIHICLRYSYCWLAHIAICSDLYVNGSFITITALFIDIIPYQCIFMLSSLLWFYVCIYLDLCSVS